MLAAVAFSAVLIGLAALVSPAHASHTNCGNARTDRGWQEVGDERGVQGNLDPAVLLGPWERVEAAAKDVLRRAAVRPGHVFNLGHGVLPDTNPDDLGRLGGARPRANGGRFRLTSCGHAHCRGDEAPELAVPCPQV
jgi:hypothetical protein